MNPSQPRTLPAQGLLRISVASPEHSGPTVSETSTNLSALLADERENEYPKESEFGGIPKLI
jgi:hypothetical protein